MALILFVLEEQDLDIHLITLQGPVWTLCTHGDWLFSGSSDKTIKVDRLLSFYIQWLRKGYRTCFPSSHLKRVKVCWMFRVGYMNNVLLYLGRS